MEQLKISEYNVERLYEVFKRLEFKSLIDKLDLKKEFYENMKNKHGNSNNYVSQDNQDNKDNQYNQDSHDNKKIILVENLEQLINLKNVIYNQKEVSFFHLLDKNISEKNLSDKDINDKDTNKKDENLAGSLIGLALSWDENNFAYIKINMSMDDEDENKSKNGENPNGIVEYDFIRVFKDILENSSIKKYGHNVKSFLLYLKGMNVNLKGLIFDTMIGAYILNPAKETYLVAELSEEYLNSYIIPVEELQGKGKNFVPFKDILCDNLIPAACEYSKAVFKLRKIIDESIKSNQQEILYYNIELPLIDILADMEYYGFKVNKNELIALSDELDGKIETLTKEIYKLAGEEFNINSPKQLGEILFEKLGLPIKKKQKPGILQLQRFLNN